ncbi:helix-turn-helix domain-containing protein [Clostridium minihomine]|uniref:helix-turn-helix domain-containing protein n=1 Tax=Clostridium minihomine TaxID=2045012 RepID=UPI000C75CD37|nr:helix-turn-helix transcriptional regulator [Clostridium minihomine]
MDEYEKAAWLAVAEKYNLKQLAYGNGKSYQFPPHWSNGWIAEMRPAPGLFVSSAWFTPNQKITHTVNVSKPCMWIFCVDCGEVIYSQQGKPARCLTPMNHVIINPQKQFRFTFPKDIHACFTSVLVFDDFIQSFLQAREEKTRMGITDAMDWESENYNTPNTMLILEQIRWGVRNMDMPLLGFEGMVLHLLASIARNAPEVPKRRSHRRNYVTWENEQKVFHVKTEMDQDILNVPPVSELAKRAGMSESKFRLSFKNIYGIPLYHYIQREIMKRAMQFLSEDHLSIRDIAERCGYQNAAKFAAAFKKIHGITPREFRKAFNL